MISHCIFATDTVAYISGASKLYDIIDELLSIMECMINNGTTIEYPIALEEEKCFEIDFYNWLYEDKQDPKMRDVMKELQIKISRAEEISNDEYARQYAAVETMNGSQSLVMCLFGSKKNILCIYNEKQYWGAKQWFLANYIQHSEFVSELEGCFPQIYFHEHVRSSFNTLNGDFILERPLIVKHLKSLNDFYCEFQKYSEDHLCFRKIAEEFQNKTEIECSTQAGRAGVRNLQFMFENNKTQEKEVICCELHTKIKWYGMDKQNQDRIYFHPGRPEIENGKILVAHIGNHL